MEPNIIRLHVISSHFDPILKSVCKGAYLSLKCTTWNHSDEDEWEQHTLRKTSWCAGQSLMALFSEIGVSMGSARFKILNTQFFKLLHKTYSKLIQNPSLSICPLNQHGLLLIPTCPGASRELRGFYSGVNHGDKLQFRRVFKQPSPSREYIKRDYALPDSKSCQVRAKQHFKPIGSYISRYVCPCTNSLSPQPSI